MPEVTNVLRIPCRLFRKAVQQGRSERRGESYSGPYGEPLNEARTQLADFVNSLLGVTMVLVAAIGTWLIWFSAFLQQNLQEESIRADCRRVMPDTTVRCVDTVIIQRGGVKQ